MLKKPSWLRFISTIKITSIRGHRCLYKKRITESLLGSLLLLKSSNDKLLIDSLIDNLIVDSFKLFVTKYIEEILQKIFKTVLETCDPFFDLPRERLLKARLSDVYYNKLYMNYYKFC